MNLKQLLGRIHPSSRKVLTAASVFTGVQSINMACSLVRNKLMAILVGPIGVGLIILYNSITDLVSMTTRMNMDQTAMREIARVESTDSAAIAHIVMRWAYFLGLCGMAFMCAFSPILSRWSFGDTSHWPSFCILSVVPFSLSVGVGYQAIMQGMREFRRIARVSLITALGGIAISIPLICILRIKSVVPIILTYAVLQGLTAWFLRVRFNKSPSIPLREVYNRGIGFVRLGAILTGGLVVTMLANYIFVLFLNSYASTSELGIYQAGYTIINTYMGVLFTGVWVEYFPSVTAVIHSSARTRIVVSHRIAVTNLVLLPIIIVTIMCAPLIVQLIYAQSFMDMLPYLVIGLAGLSLKAASWCLAVPVVAKGDGGAYLCLETASAVTGLVLNIIGFTTFGFYGLGVAYVLWYGIYLGLTYGVYRWRLGRRIRRSSLILVAIVFPCVMAAAILRLAFGWWAPILPGLIACGALYYYKKHNSK